MIKKLQLMIAVAFVFTASTAFGQSSGSDGAVIVRPGAPGQPTLRLPPDTRAQLPPVSVKDVEFMQGMIMHHAQAVEMTALIEERTENQDIRLLGSRISQSQEDEMAFMRRWLTARGQSLTMGSKQDGHGHTAKTSYGLMKMPGMLSEEQMEALRNAKGAEFDRLFLSGMIQHHEGALAMVKDLFDTAGTGQDAELFNFASDVDSGQRAEIKTMETLLGKKP
ncbi:MAG: DUF305 domain-containing protein [Pyrinomonadaceae bacterium]|nr:DUF305 domain-containing protein [Pyrinomonadaceae bacterium]